MIFCYPENVPMRVQFFPHSRKHISVYLLHKHCNCTNVTSLLQNHNVGDLTLQQEWVQPISIHRFPIISNNVSW